MNCPDPITIAQATARVSRHLRNAGVPDATSDARVLVSAVTGLSRHEMLCDPDIPVSVKNLRLLDDVVLRRARREPVSRIIGYREFMGLGFSLGQATLDPRPDSEVLVETAADWAEKTGGPLRVLDMGTGSGCLLLSILDQLPQAEGVGTDISEDACRVAAFNARELGLAARAAFVNCVWAQPLGGQFDLVVSNPPYVPSGEIVRLAPEVRDFDPRAALDGGIDGLDGFRGLADSAAARLAPEGLLIVEISPGQAQGVTAILGTHNLIPAGLRTDLSGKERALLFFSGNRSSR